MPGTGAAVTAWDDTNWLIIAGRILADFDDPWSFAEPCMTAFDARNLGEWLQQAADGQHPARIDFLEPNLAFTLTDPTTATVEFAQEAARPGTPIDGHVEVALPMHPAALAQAAADWRTETDAYPPR